MTHLDASIEVVAAPHLAADARLINRELSWLDFNERVLSLADDPARPLLERARFLSIFSSNLDEFFQIRVAGLKEQVEAGVGSAPDALTPVEQLEAVRERVLELCKRQSRIFIDDVSPALEKAAIRFVHWDELSEDDRAWLIPYFERRIFPVLTPLAVDPAHPFPYVSNLSLNLAVVVSDPTNAEPRFARVKVPQSLPRFVRFPDGESFLPLEELIAARVELLFPGMEILAHDTFRVTRNADLELEEDEAEDLLEAIESGLRLRRRSPHAVRLEIDARMSDEVREILVDELEIEPEDIYPVDALLDLGCLAQLYDLDRPDIKDDPLVPATQPRLASVRTDPIEGSSSIFDVLRSGEVLVHHPYDSFTTSVQRFIEEAAVDPLVLAIKWTLYRTSGPESPIIRNLIRAAELGKQVVALVELKARFDEAANITWARALEESGVHVVYGVVGLKTHAKIALVLRQERNEIVRYTHIGTGNYNPNTATTYEDLGLLSADPEIGADASDLFNFLTGYSRQRVFRKLVVAPLGLREQLLDLLSEEAARPDGRVVMKMNNLVDPKMIEALYDASGRGTQIDLVVRGICSLRPGVPGLSETIRVRSILGRFLEHSRIFRFGVDDQAAYYIGSADLMSRNLDHRVEALVPVTGEDLKARLGEILATDLADDTLAWELQPDGSWKRAQGEDGINTHDRLREIAQLRARGGRSD